METAKKISIGFWGGESRKNPGSGCNYMIAHTEDGTELYAEVLVDNTIEDDEYGYEELKVEIIRQAKTNGIDSECLDFNEK